MVFITAEHTPFSAGSLRHFNRKSSLCGFTLTLYFVNTYTITTDDTTTLTLFSRSLVLLCRTVRLLSSLGIKICSNNYKKNQYYQIIQTYVGKGYTRPLFLCFYRLAFSSRKLRIVYFNKYCSFACLFMLSVYFIYARLFMFLSPNYNRKRFWVRTKHCSAKTKISWWRIYRGLRLQAVFRHTTNPVVWVASFILETDFIVDKFVQ